MPGFSDGMVNVEKDEQRHIAFGVKLLADLNREDPEVRPAIREILGEVMPHTVGVFRPPNDDERYIEVFGETMVGVATTGQRQLDTRLQAAGIERYGPEGVLPFFDEQITHEERAARAFVMQRAGLFSGGAEPVRSDPQALEYYFDIIAASVSPAHKLKKRTTLQWEFSDGPTWHITIDGPSARSDSGSVPKPDVIFRTDLSTWVGVTSGSIAPGKAVVTRKLRIKGNPLTLAKLTGVFER